MRYRNGQQIVPIFSQIKIYGLFWSNSSKNKQFFEKNAVNEKEMNCV